MANEPSNSRKVRSKRYRSPILTPTDGVEKTIQDRQKKVPGFDQNALGDLHLTLVGAGGLGSEIGEGFVRKGVGYLTVIDPDTVQLSNLNRQKFFEEDLYHNKATSLAKNLVREGGMGTIITPYDKSFQEVEIPPPDMIIAAVDNNPTRRDVAKYCIDHEIPGIFTGVSTDADHGYVFVQEQDKACWGCAFPEAAQQREEPCPGSPAVKDILKLMGALVLYGVDTLIMDRTRTWNYRESYLADPSFNIYSFVEKNDDCPICGVS